MTLQVRNGGLATRFPQLCEHTVSEDDIRTKVVYSWLAGCGFVPSEISIEYGFEIRLGRGTMRVGGPEPSNEASNAQSGERVARPRADVLVRRNGLNLMVVEVKTPDELLDEQARDQGISYARLLPQIAPFVVVTNGLQAKIYDAITRNELTGEAIPLNHPTVRAGFRVACDDIQLRTEALDWFVSLSPANLLTFCEKQAAFRMTRLRDNDPASGKKYIPSLYVERNEPWNRLSRLLDDQNARVVAVVGRPQVGKTNSLCHFAEDRLRRGHPVLFFPSGGLDSGLFDAVSEDFGWILGDTNSTAVLVNKLTAVVRRTGSRVTLFIDGWNEADLEVARSVDRACERLASTDIQVVISFTHSAARRLLARAGNPSFVAQETGIGLAGIDLIEADPSAASHDAYRERNPDRVSVPSRTRCQCTEVFPGLKSVCWKTVHSSVSKDPQIRSAKSETLASVILGSTPAFQRAPATTYAVP